MTQSCYIHMHYSFTLLIDKLMAGIAWLSCIEGSLHIGMHLKPRERNHNRRMIGSAAYSCHDTIQFDCQQQLMSVSTTIS